MIDKELKPCPFCGGDAYIMETEGCDFVAGCNDCSCTIFDDMTWEVDDYDGRKNCIENWNKRASQ